MVQYVFQNTVIIQVIRNIVLPGRKTKLVVLQIVDKKSMAFVSISMLMVMALR